MQLGLLERRRKGDYIFLEDKAELENEKVYYLYFRETPLRSESPCGGDDSKRVRPF